MHKIGETARQAIQRTALENDDAVFEFDGEGLDAIMSYEYGGSEAGGVGYSGTRIYIVTEYDGYNGVIWLERLAPSERE